MPGCCLPGSPDAAASRADAWLSGSVGPDSLAGMDGFFYALLLKRPAD